MDWDAVRNFADVWMDKQSFLNRPYAVGCDTFDNYLKLTFEEQEHSLAVHLVDRFARMNYVRVGYYRRERGEITVVSAVKRKSPNPAKTALKMMRTVLSVCGKAVLADHNREQSQLPNKRCLLVAKFFLYHLLGNHTIDLVNTLTRGQGDSPAYACRGKTQRCRELKRRMAVCQNEDNVHEAEVLLNWLNRNECNEMTLLIPSSIRVKNEYYLDLCEFDGMILFPMRDQNQIVFFEAKNRDEISNKSLARKELGKKFKELALPINPKSIQTDGIDAYCVYSM